MSNDDEDSDLVAYFYQKAPRLEMVEGEPWTYYLLAQHKIKWAEEKVASLSEEEKAGIRGQWTKPVCT